MELSNKRKLVIIFIAVLVLILLIGVLNTILILLFIFLLTFIILVFYLAYRLSIPIIGEILIIIVSIKGYAGNYKNTNHLPVSPLDFFHRYQKIKKAKNKKPRGNFVAIILANKYFPGKIEKWTYILETYLLNIDKIIDYFEDKQIRYAIFECKTARETKKIIFNKMAKSIILIGHGHKHGIGTSKKEMLYYCTLKGAPQKKIIAQFHCNHFKGSPITDYVKCKKSFITNDKMNTDEINEMIDKMIKNKTLKFV